MLAHHGRVAVTELTGYPFNWDVAGQCLASECVACLISASMANACFLKVGGEPIADGLAVPQQAGGGVVEQEADPLLLLRDVVSLHNSDGQGQGRRFPSRRTD